MSKMILLSIKLVVISLWVTLGIQSIKVNSTNTSPDFKVFIETYEQLSNTKVTTPISFVDKFEDNVVGVCYTYVNGLREIKVSKRFWFNNSYATKEQLIFHELAHCEAGLDHDDKEIVKNGWTIPKTIMNSVLVNNYIYTTFRQYYLDELFNKRILKK